MKILLSNNKKEINPQNKVHHFPKYSDIDQQAFESGKSTIQPASNIEFLTRFSDFTKRVESVSLLELLH